MEIQYGNSDLFLELQKRAVEFSETFTGGDFEACWEAARDSLRDCLSKKWKESCFGDEDFAISDSFTYNWLQAGGIYSINALNQSFISEIFKSIDCSTAPAKWTVHFAVEIWNQPEHSMIDSEILIFDGSL